MAEGGWAHLAEALAPRKKYLGQRIQYSYTEV